MTRKRKRTFDANGICKEAARNKSAAGLRNLGRGSAEAEAEWRRQIAIMPDDTRDLTARVFGDPIPGDPRRHWLNG